MHSWDPLAELTPEQRQKLREYGRLLVDVSQRVNLISPASAPEVETRHLRHSLALSLRAFPPGVQVVDWGSGGGLPSIPLAIRFPETQFVAVDSVGKKVDAVRLFARRLELPNVAAWAGRAETWPGSADYAVSRATAPLADLWGWYARVANEGEQTREGIWKRGLVCLKGGDLTAEIDSLRQHHGALHIERIPLVERMVGDGLAGKEIVAVRRTLAEDRDG